MFRFFSGFGHPRPVPTLPPPAGTPANALTQQDGYSFFLGLGPLSNVNEKYFKNDVPFWTEMTQHANYDEYWQARDLRRHLKNIKPAVMTVGGWFDAEDLFGALNTYKEIEKNSPGANNMLVMGPWFHGGWSRSDGDSLGRVQFGSKTSVFYRDEIEFPFFDHWLKGKADPKLPEAFVFETGTNQWRREDAWPPKDAQPEDALPPGRWPPRLRFPEAGRRFRRVRQRSRQARALHRRPGSRHDPRAHGGRPALRLQPHRRAHLSDRSCSKPTSPSPVPSPRRCSFPPAARIPIGSSN